MRRRLDDSSWLARVISVCLHYWRSYFNTAGWQWKSLFTLLVSGSHSLLFFFVIGIWFFFSAPVQRVNVNCCWSLTEFGYQHLQIAFSVSGASFWALLWSTSSFCGQSEWYVPEITTSPPNVNAYSGTASAALLCWNPRTISCFCCYCRVWLFWDGPNKKKLRPLCATCTQLR